MKKWLVPLSFPFVSIAAVLLSGVAGVLGNGDGTGYGGIVIALCGIIVYCVIVIPVMCLLYSKKCLLEQRFRFLFTVYNSFLISLPYFVFFSLHDVEIDFYVPLIIFGWCELWALLGFVNFKGKKTKQNVG